ncbi:MAG: cell division protein ZapA [Candidatus Eisenbacteria bacterium]|nr:cell division protein ZapA [Candidatus Eisenbacteria bacterium]
MGKRSVVVHVGGQRYVVRSDADETYIRTLAGYLDDRIKEVSKRSKPVTSQSLAVLAALNIADELFQERRKRVELRQRVKDKSRAMIAYLDKEVKARLDST